MSKHTDEVLAIANSADFNAWLRDQPEPVEADEEADRG